MHETSLRKLFFSGCLWPSGKIIAFTVPFCLYLEIFCDPSIIVQDLDASEMAHLEERNISCLVSPVLTESHFLAFLEMSWRRGAVNFSG